MADPSDLKEMMDEYHLRLTQEMRYRIDSLKDEDTTFIEIVVSPESPLVGRGRSYLRRRSSNQLVLIAVARQGKPIHKRLGKVQFAVGDVLLLQGSEEELKNNALIMADIPAPPPSSLSVISPPNSSESSSNKIATQAASTLNSSSAQHNKYRRLEIHKNISAVVKQLSVYANKKKTNDIVPLETLPRLRTVSSQIDNKYLDLIDKKVDNVAFNNFNVDANIQTTTSSHYLHQSTKRPFESTYCLCSW